MEPIEDPFVSSSSRKDYNKVKMIMEGEKEKGKEKEEEEKEAVDLLEKCWFFDNLLHRKTKMMLRCYSDPCPSTNFGQELMLVNNNSCPPPTSSSSSSSSSSSPSSSIRKVSKDGNDGDGDDGFLNPKLDQESFSSPPPFMGSVEEEIRRKKEDDPNLDQESFSSQSFMGSVEEEIRRKKEYDALGLGRMNINKSTQKSSRNGLLRTPSLPLPPCIGEEEEVMPDIENDHKLSKLIRQASLNPPKALPPRSTSKGIQQNSTVPKNGLRRLARAESMKMDKAKKSLRDLEFEEVQGFKDLGFRFEKKDLSPSVVDIIPGLQEKSENTKNDIVESDKVRPRPYLSEAWLVPKNYAPPPIPNWVVKKSAEEDMKAHIKFWARSVASNVR